MNAANVEDRDLFRFQRPALVAGIVAAVACVVGAIFDAAGFFRSWLLAYCFWISLALGSLGVLMLHNIVGGRWGALIRRFLESGMRTLPLMALLAIPILLSIPVLYHWAHPEAVEHDPVLLHKEPYLNVPFFVGRTVLYFAIWTSLAFLLQRRRFDPGPAPSSVKAISGPGLIVFVFTVTFAAVDWIMSLEPHWFSTIYGAIFVVGQALATFAFCTALLIVISRRSAFAELANPNWLHDLGNLLLAFTCLWAYTSFSQFLIIWSANIPEETPWYLRRSHGGWQFVSVFLIVFHFFVPFAILLSRQAKRRGRILIRVCLWILFVRLVDLVYWIEPSFDHHVLSVFLWIPVALIAIGGLWSWLFLAQLRRGPLVYTTDPRLAEDGGHH